MVKKIEETTEYEVKADTDKGNPNLIVAVRYVKNYEKCLTNYC